jgi:hypothetical protein
VGKLEDLIVDEATFDRDVLGSALLPYLRIAGDGTFRPTEKWSSLNRRNRILAVCLAAKAAHVLEKRSVEALTASEVGELSGVPGGTARPTLRDLVDAHLLSQDAERRYYVAGMAVPAAVKALNG